MSSTASNVSATPAAASSPWPQSPPANQDNGGGPFAALLDAATSPDSKNTQPTSATGRPTHVHDGRPVYRKIPALAATNGTTGAAQPTSPGAQAAADTTKNANAAASPVASSNVTVNPNAAQNATANQAGTAVPTDTTGGRDGTRRFCQGSGG